MKKDKPTIQKAMDLWIELAYFNGRTDAMVNDLLETICYASGTPYYKIEDDPIYFSIFNLTNAGRRVFIKYCKKIKATITPEEIRKHKEVCK